MEDHINEGYSKEKSITIHNGYEILSKISTKNKKGRPSALFNGLKISAYPTLIWMAFGFSTLGTTIFKIPEFNLADILDPSQVAGRSRP